MLLAAHTFLLDLLWCVRRCATAGVLLQSLNLLFWWQAVGLLCYLDPL